MPDRLDLITFLLGLLLAVPMAAQVDSTHAREIYEATCARCHSNSRNTRAPQLDALRGMAPGAILGTMERGRMQRYARDLSVEDQRMVSEWLAGQPIVPVTMPSAAFCGSLPAEASLTDVLWTGWGGNPEGTGYQPPDRAGLQAEEVPDLELAWAFGFPNANEVRSKPAIIGNQLIVASQPGVVYSLDAATGCIQWTYDAGAQIRSSVEIGRGPDGALTAYVVDGGTTVHALDPATGALHWTSRAGDDPTPMNTGTPVYHDGSLYVPISSLEIVLSGNPQYECCRSSGGVAAIDAVTGTLRWYHRVIPEPATEVGRREDGRPIYAPSGAPVWSSPTIDAARGRLYVGTGENYTRPTNNTSDAILAINLTDGSLAWAYQATADDAYNLACGNRSANCPDPTGPDVDFGMAPILTTLADGRDMLVVGQKSGVVFGFDPDGNGEPLWSTKIGRGGMLGGIHWGIAIHDGMALVPNADNPLALTPGDFPPAPGMFGIDIASGDLVWDTPAPNGCEPSGFCRVANSAQPAAIDGVVFAGSLDGHIRAYDTQTGAILWDYDTARDYQTVNGVPANGGSLDAAGPVIAGGMVYVNSGYAQFAQMSGNVLLAFRSARN